MITLPGDSSVLSWSRDFPTAYTTLHVLWFTTVYGLAFNAEIDKGNDMKITDLTLVWRRLQNIFNKGQTNTSPQSFRENYTVAQYQHRCDSSELSKYFP